MPGPADALTRGQARVWLKYVVGSGLLDKLPGRFDDVVPGKAPGPHALALLGELRNPDDAGRPVAEIMADVRRFREWVEARQKRARRVILSEGRPADGVIESLIRRRDGVVTSRTESERPAPRPPARPVRPTPTPRSHPLFDDWLDG